MINKIKREIENYKSEIVQISEDNSFSQYKLVRRIMLYKNKIYPKGKLDSQGNYKYWYDIVAPRVDSEIKNIDFDTKDITLDSDAPKDFIPLFFATSGLREYLRDNGEAEKLNESIEQFTEFGNVLWKKTKEGYESCDFTDTYILNQTARTIEDTAVIERKVISASQLRSKADIWNDTDKLRESFQGTDKAPRFEIYERNGEISEEELRLAQGKSGGDKEKYLLAKVIVGGLEREDPTVILYAEEIKKMPYKEAHRGKFSGRWFRVGMYELLFDEQTRANEIGNQIANGLKLASKTAYFTKDKTVAQNILTDLENGDILTGIENLGQVNTRMPGFDQLIADWNRNLQQADKLANSFEVVTGEALPSGTPFKLGEMLDQNSNKLFNYLREKIGIAFEELIQDWVLDKVMGDLKAKDILRLTGDAEYLNRYYQLLVDSWYINNLLYIGPHDPEMGTEMKAQKLKEVTKNKNTMAKLEKEMWKGVKPRVRVNIVGENINLPAELETLKSFIQLEQDPIRRTALITKAMSRKGIDVSTMPKTEVQPMQTVNK